MHAHGDDYVYTKQCRACVPGEYCFENELSDCPPHSTSDPLSGSITDCVCHAGYKAAADHTCSECVNGEYCLNEVVSLCSSISSNMISAPKSSQASDCMCDVGFTWDDAFLSCVACVAGTYKSAAGSEACTNCASGKYSNSVAATTATVCQDCPVLSQSSAGSDDVTDCLCAPGSTGADGGPCAYCAAGTFKDSAGSEACVDCSQHNAGGGEGASRRRRLLSVYAPLAVHSNSVYYSAVVGSTSFSNCQTCPAHSRISGNLDGSSGTSVTDCQCFEGFTLIEGSCVACEAGHYKSTTGSDPCLECEEGKYNALLAATTSLQCLDCPHLSSTQVKASVSIASCQCTPGTFGTNGVECTPCAAGSTSNGFSDDVTCTQCPAGSYEDDATNSCVACTQFATTPNPGSTTASACMCLAGYQPQNLALLGSELICEPCDILRRFSVYSDVI